MFTVVITEKGGAQRRMEFDKPEVTIGRVQGNDIILPKGNVSKRHSRIVLKDSRFIVVDLKSTNGTYVNGRKITSPLVVKPGDKIYIGDFIMTVEEGQEMGASVPAPAPAYEEPPAAAPPAQSRRSPVGPPPLRPASAPPTNAPPPMPRAEPEPAPPAPEPDRYALDEEPSGDQPAPRVAPAAGPAPRQRKRTVQESQPPPMAPPSVPAHPPPQAAPPPAAAPAPSMSASSQGARPAPAPAPAPVAPIPDRPGLEGALRAVMARTAREFDIHDADPASLANQARWAAAQQVVDSVVGQLSREGVLSDVRPDELSAAAVREAVGLGTLEAFMSDDSVREVVVEGPKRIMADYGRGLERVGGIFSSADAVLTVARRLIAQGGGRIEPGRAVFHTALPYGPHVTVILPPVAVRGPMIEIRRMGGSNPPDSLVGRGVMSAEMLELLRDAVAAHVTIAVVGPGGSGVTSTLGAIAGLVDARERIATVEDLPDLSVDHENRVALSTGGAGSGLTLKDVVRQAGLVRADRLVIDDVRGAELFDVLSELAAHPAGALIGVHAVGHASLELARMGRLGTRAAPEAVADLVVRTVRLVVELDRDDQGVRRAMRISEVTSAKGGEVGSQDLFVYDGGFAATGAKPTFRV